LPATTDLFMSSDVEESDGVPGGTCERDQEVLRAWLAGAGHRVAGQRAGVDRKTARRYVEAGQAAGLFRDGGGDTVRHGGIQFHRRHDLHYPYLFTRGLVLPGAAGIFAATDGQVPRLSVVQALTGLVVESARCAPLGGPPPARWRLPSPPPQPQSCSTRPGPPARRSANAFRSTCMRRRRHPLSPLERALALLCGLAGRRDARAQPSSGGAG
jgi:hypothetical protein